MAEKINKEMTFGELMNNFPNSAQVLANYGLHCIGCHGAIMETIEQGARAHGLSDADIDKMMQELNGSA